MNQDTNNRKKPLTEFSITRYNTIIFYQGFTWGCHLNFRVWNFDLHMFVSRLYAFPIIQNTSDNHFCGMYMYMLWIWSFHMIRYTYFHFWFLAHIFLACWFTCYVFHLNPKHVFPCENNIYDMLAFFSCMQK